MKLIFLFILILLSAIGCHPPDKPEREKIAAPENGFASDTTIVTKNYSFHIKARNIDSNLVSLEATIGDQPALLDTLSGQGLMQPEFPDFNKDGYPDILLYYNANNTTNFLYLFDPLTNKFISIDGFINFPDAVQLQAKPAYYYSYYPEGCSDLNWVSDLFKIEAFRAIKIGHIYGKGCEFNVLENPKFIGIYKIDPNNLQSEAMIDKLPYQESIPTIFDKEEFLKKYWNTNYRKFE